jgi:hypothetical protein
MIEWGQMNGPGARCQHNLSTFSLLFTFRIVKHLLVYIQRIRNQKTSCDYMELGDNNGTETLSVSE